MILAGCLQQRPSVVAAEEDQPGLFLLLQYVAKLFHLPFASSFNKNYKGPITRIQTAYQKLWRVIQKWPTIHPAQRKI